MNIMQAKLMVFSIIHVAPPAFKTPYGVGIAEDLEGRRMLVRIKEECLNDLKPNVEGDVRVEKLDDQDLNFFYPKP